MSDRCKIPFGVETKVEVSSKYVIAPVVGATVSAINRETKASSPIYAAETGAGTIPSPVTDENGNCPGWLEEGAYNIKVSGGSPAISPVEFAWDAVSGRKEGIEASQIAPEAITQPKIAAALLGPTASSYGLRKLGTGATEALPGNAIIKGSQIEAEAITDAAIVKGRALIETGNAYGALTERAASTPFTPSTTRTTFVSLLIVMHPEAPSAMNIFVGGGTLSGMALTMEHIASFEVDAKAPAGIPQFSYSFICPPGRSWEWKNNGAERVYSSYLTL